MYEYIDMCQIFKQIYIQLGLGPYTGPGPIRMSHVASVMWHTCSFFSCARYHATCNMHHTTCVMYHASCDMYSMYRVYHVSLFFTLGLGPYWAALPPTTIQNPNILYEHPNILYEHAPTILYQIPRLVYESPKVLYEHLRILYEPPSILYNTPTCLHIFTQMFGIHACISSYNYVVWFMYFNIHSYYVLVDSWYI